MELVITTPIAHVLELNLLLIEPRERLTSSNLRFAR